MKRGSGRFPWGLTGSKAPYCRLWKPRARPSFAGPCLQVRVGPCALLCGADSCPNTAMVPLSASSFHHHSSPVRKMRSFLPVLDMEARPREAV